MEEEIKNLLNCGYYDDCHNYIVELNEEKMKDFFKIFFKADTVIFANKDYEKVKMENQKLNEKFDYMMENHRKELDEMKNYVDRTAREVEKESEKRMCEIINEQEKRYNMLKQQGRDMIKAFANYL
uniref:Uncharacterized protein n=2 Tax=unclassified Caudoviricetes TaxID=2788787 RepID=A0A8S5MA34_9CAUD|nr:MAG TPA: hypothetical protein [Siphoviridae sp. ctsDY37]DAF96065.1 MAG TPA: hypothetical protein [Siphoviridae sp. cteLB10]